MVLEDFPGPLPTGSSKESSDSTAVPRPLGLPTPLMETQEILSKEVMSPRAIPQEVIEKEVVSSRAVEPASSSNDEKVLNMLQVLALPVGDFTKASNEKDARLQLLENLITKREEKWHKKVLQMS